MSKVKQFAQAFLLLVLTVHSSRSTYLITLFIVFFVFLIHALFMVNLEKYSVLQLLFLKQNNGNFFLCICKQTLEFSNSNNIVVSDLTSLNSQMFHIVVNGCQKVKMQGVKVTAAGNSPNTDGIHVQSSSTVTILNSKIGTGDDCISIGPGTSNLWIENVACGPGHGIRYLIYLFLF